MKKSFLFLILILLDFSFVRGMNRGEFESSDALNEALKNLEVFLIQQEAITPLEATCFLKSEEDPFSYYKPILKAYRGMRQESLQIVHVDGYGSLAATFLGFIKKRMLYRKCTNAEEVAHTSKEIDEYMNSLKKGEDDLYLYEGIFDKTPKIEIIKDEEEKRKREIEFLLDIMLFEEEIERALQEENTSYEWFMLFCDQLSVLSSKFLSYRSFSNVNTHYAAYFEYVDKRRKFPNFSKEKYFTSFDRVNYTMSLPGLINQFPFVFMMPYPFILEPLDFLNLTIGKSQLFWPCGFVFGTEIADGWHHCPRTFFGHDWHHLGLLVSSILSPCLFGKSFNLENEEPELLKNMFYTIQSSFSLYCLS